LNFLAGKSPCLSAGADEYSADTPPFRLPITPMVDIGDNQTDNIGDIMNETSDQPQSNRLINSLVPAIIFIFLALMYSNPSPLLRYSFAAAGIAFLIKAILTFLNKPDEDKDTENKDSG
jgi:hypothetical protein